MTDEPRLQAEPREGVPDVIDTLPAFREYCSALASSHGSLAADAERASGFRYGHDDWLVQFKRDGAGIGLLDPQALAAEGADWNDFNRAVGDAVWILHDSLQDLPGFADLGLQPKRLFDTEIAARLLGLKRFGLAAVTEHYLGLTLAKEHSAADWSYRPLPRDWRNYAALDVELLIELESTMRAELQKQGKIEWAEEEFDYALREGTAPRKEHPIPWLRISHITEIMKDRQALAVAKALWTKRDELAREYDISPTLLLADSTIIEVAERKPHNAAQFRAVRSINERVRIQAGAEQEKMFERYAPIQRKIKPSMWKRIIQQALDLPESEWPVIESGNPQNQEAQSISAPRATRVWRERYPERLATLDKARKMVAQIAEDTRTPADVIIKPQYLRNLCWTDEPQKRDVAQFLTDQGARAWQVALVAESVSRAIM